MCTPLLLEELAYHPDLCLDEMQKFLAEHRDVEVDTSTISQPLEQASWMKKAVKNRALQYHGGEVRDVNK